ncbi:MAG: SurA N-terminal domain-containing protein [Nitrospirae bacterium]|nr:SurA N-terminal domain-containing protein [Nitrospirota bacterium]
MLKSMRKHAKFFYVLFIIVILSFIFWGVGTVDKPTTVSIAEIGKEKITVEEYWRAYERMRETFREMYKGQFNEDMEKKMKLKELVLNSLIEERVLLLSARELGLTVTDRELQDAITSDPRFMRDGIFRKDVYFKTLDLNRLTPDMFENSLRQQLTAAKMRRFIWAAADVNPLDLKGISGDEKKVNEALQSIFMNQRNAAITSYVDGVKRRMHLKVNMDILS